MTIEEIENIIANWGDSFTNKQKRYIHFDSLRNFVFHFRNLPDGKLQEGVLSQLNEYVREIEKHNLFLTNRESYALATRHTNFQTFIHPIGI